MQHEHFSRYLPEGVAYDIPLFNFEKTKNPNFHIIIKSKKQHDCDNILQLKYDPIQT